MNLKQIKQETEKEICFLKKERAEIESEIKLLTDSLVNWELFSEEDFLEYLLLETQLGDLQERLEIIDFEISEKWDGYKELRKIMWAA
jgi:hypothetical protein